MSQKTQEKRYVCVKIRDYEVGSWKKLSRMSLDLSDYSARDVPTGGLIPKTMAQDNRFLR